MATKSGFSCGNDAFFSTVDAVSKCDDRRGLGSRVEQNAAREAFCDRSHHHGA
jgi:hypothetical protein